MKLAAGCLAMIIDSRERKIWK